MQETTEIFDAGIDVNISEHESGYQKTYFSRFECHPVTREHFSSVLESVRNKSGATPITQVYVKSHQELERQILESMGFTVDGLNYNFDVSQLAEIICQKPSDTIADYEIRAVNFEEDISELVEIEKSIHAADKTSRVNFETDRSISSMKQYYRRIASNHGAFVLTTKEKIVGVVGFMAPSKDLHAANISSVGIALDHQRKDLFFPFVYRAFMMSPYRHIKTLAGVTTTSRLIAVAERYGATIAGYILSRSEAHSKDSRPVHSS
jgi:hypothetical protein